MTRAVARVLFSESNVECNIHTTCSSIRIKEQIARIKVGADCVALAANDITYLLQLSPIYAYKQNLEIDSVEFMGRQHWGLYWLRRESWRQT